MKISNKVVQSTALSVINSHRSGQLVNQDSTTGSSQPPSQSSDKPSSNAQITSVSPTAISTTSAPKTTITHNFPPISQEAIKSATNTNASLTSQQHHHGYKNSMFMMIKL